MYIYIYICSACHSDCQSISWKWSQAITVAATPVAVIRLLATKASQSVSQSETDCTNVNKLIKNDTGSWQLPLCLHMCSRVLNESKSCGEKKRKCSVLQWKQKKYLYVAVAVEIAGSWEYFAECSKCIL